MNEAYTYTSRASRSEYLYGSSVAALEPQSTFEVIPGRRANNGPVTLPASIIGIAKVILVVAAILAALGCVRVGFAAASINTSMASDQISAQIDAARSISNDLEVQRAQLSNSMHIRIEAKSLGMAAPVDFATITLPEDVVAVDEAGNLSLGRSLAVMASQG